MRFKVEGSDITRRTRVISGPEIDESEFQRVYTELGGFEPVSEDHEGEEQGIENLATTILENVGLPIDPDGFYRYNPSGNEPWQRAEGSISRYFKEIFSEPEDPFLMPHQAIMRFLWLCRKEIPVVSPGGKRLDVIGIPPRNHLPLTPLVLQLGYAFDSHEGFAARILTELHEFRLWREEGDIEQALSAYARLWFMAGQMEAKAAIRLWRHRGSQPRVKFLKGIQKFINDQVEANPGKPLNYIWQYRIRKNYSSIFEAAEVSCDGEDYSIYVDGDSLCQCDSTGKINQIKLRSLDRYYQRARTACRH